MDRSAEALVNATGITAGYGSKQVLSDVSLSVKPSEVVGLLGPNGAGKTTLLKVLCGALAPWSGTVQIKGQEVRALSNRARAKLASFVPQSEDHAFDFTVRELTLMGRIAWSDGLFESEEDHDAAERAMAAADCSEFADRPLSTLSGGEAQRALVARALAQDAPAIFCDEPATHLDPRHQVETARLLKRLGEEGHAIIVTTHDLNLAEACCDRVLLLHEGSVAFEGSLAEAAESGSLERVFATRFVRIYDGTDGYTWPVR